MSSKSEESKITPKSLREMGWDNVTVIGKFLEALLNYEFLRGVCCSDYANKVKRGSDTLKLKNE